MTSNAGVKQAELERNVAGGAHAAYDPHPLFDQLREEGAVIARSLPSLFGLPAFAGMPETEHAFTVIGYDAAETAFRDHKAFSSAQVHRGFVDSFGSNILLMDEPEHRKYRALAQPAFAMKAMQSWDDR